MSSVLTLEMTPERPSGGVLLHLAVMLRQLNIDPESLVWTTTAPNGALKIRLVLSDEDEHWMGNIADHLKRSSGVRDVRCEAAGNEMPPAVTPVSGVSDAPIE